eukprot:GEMP01112251.1.p1 GENE.GEMP01112251.1~~GEMP01112251.1.p1  ORF type:complete len:150 (+),score=36.30 GEMP01112251.1:50-499(+)
MDTTALLVFREIMKKEQKFQKQWDLENGKEEEEFEEEPPRTSAAMHFLEQQMGLEKSPYDIRGKKKPGFSDKDLLYSGVTKECEGRYAYLKTSAKLWPQDKSDYPTSESQEVGWAARSIHVNASSPFARKPLIKDTFFRVNGVPLKMDN